MVINNTVMIGDYVAQLKSRYSSLLVSPPVAEAGAASLAESSQSTRARPTGVLLNSFDVKSTNPFDEKSTNPFDDEDDTSKGARTHSNSASNSTASSAAGAAASSPSDESTEENQAAAGADARRTGPSFESILASVDQLIEFGYKIPMRTVLATKVQRRFSTCM